MRLSLRCVIWCVMLVAAALGLAPAHAQLRGHGGPIRALAISADGMTVLSGSFDTSAIRWSLRYNLAEQVLRLHESAVNAVAILNDGRAVTGGADALIGIWTPGKPVPDAILRGHEGPIVALAVSPDGGTLASASWDRTVRLWPLAGGPPIVLKGHQQNVNGVAFAPDGTAVVSVGYDAGVRIWPLPQPVSPSVADGECPTFQYQTCANWSASVFISSRNRVNPFVSEGPPPVRGQVSRRHRQDRVGSRTFLECA
jgi:cytochrome c